MRRISFLVLMVALTAAYWTDSQAAGSFQTKPAFQSVVTAGVARLPPHTSLPNSVPSSSAGDFVGGCGRGRIRTYAAVRPISDDQPGYESPVPCSTHQGSRNWRQMLPGWRVYPMPPLGLVGRAKRRRLMGGGGSGLSA
jgi:hypothetical protein